MVDTTIYRDGAIQRSSGHYAQWMLICDEIVALRQRYCSLRSKPSTDPIEGRLLIDVSTGDNGQPAALLHLPLAVSLGFGVEVAVDTSHQRRARQKKTSAAESVHVAIATCDQRECLAAWSLNTASIQALNKGAGLHLTFCTTGPGPLEFASDLRRQSCRIKTLGLVSGGGFHDAVQASFH